MTDLVARLRTFPRFGSQDGDRWYKLGGTDQTCTEAADEIERLRARLESYRTRGRDLMLHDPEMKDATDELKRRIAQDPEFRRSIMQRSSDD